MSKFIYRFFVALACGALSFALSGASGGTGGGTATGARHGSLGSPSTVHTGGGFHK